MRHSFWGRDHLEHSCVYEGRGADTTNLIQHRPFLLCRRCLDPVYDRFGAGLALLGLETPAAAQLAAALKSKRTDKRLDLDLDNSLSWTEFKRGHRPPAV